jgi:uncharacterized protein YegJ (DUF2314 family)
MIRTFILPICLLTFACTSNPAPTLMQTTTGTDTELDAAIQQARDSLPTFIQTIATPHADRTIVAVKVRFTPVGESSQDIWVDEITYSDGIFRGSMGDDIPSMKLEVGEKIVVDEKDILDWMVVQDGKLIGGYTIRLAMQRMDADERQRFLQSLDYVIED